MASVRLVRLTSEVLQQLDLSECTLGQNLLAKYICDLLDSDTITCLVVLRRAASLSAQI